MLLDRRVTYKNDTKFNYRFNAIAIKMPTRLSFCFIEFDNIIKHTIKSRRPQSKKWAHVLFR